MRDILSCFRLYRIEKYSSIYTLVDNKVSKRNIQSIPLYLILQIKTFLKSICLLHRDIIMRHVECNSPWSMHIWYCHDLCLSNIWSFNLNALNNSFVWVFAGRIILLTNNTVRSSVSTFSVNEGVDTYLRCH